MASSEVFPQLAVDIAVRDFASYVDFDEELITEKMREMGFSDLQIQRTRIIIGEDSDYKDDLGTSALYSFEKEGCEGIIYVHPNKIDHVNSQAELTDTILHEIAHQWQFRVKLGVDLNKRFPERFLNAAKARIIELRRGDIEEEADQIAKRIGRELSYLLVYVEYLPTANRWFDTVEVLR